MSMNTEAAAPAATHWSAAAPAATHRSAAAPARSPAGPGMQRQQLARRRRRHAVTRGDLGLQRGQALAHRRIIAERGAHFRCRRSMAGGIPGSALCG